MKKIILILVLVCMISLASAASISYIFKQGNNINLKVPCFDGNYSKCTSLTNCNITIFYPDHTILADGVEMTYNENYFNYSLTSEQTNILGEHSAQVLCVTSLDNGFSTFNYLITLSGEEPIIFPIQLSIFALSFILIFFGSMKDRFKMFKSLGSLLAMVMGIITLYPGYGGINFSTLTGLALGSIGIGGGFYFLIEDSFSREIQQQNYEQEPEFEDDGRFHE